MFALSKKIITMKKFLLPFTIVIMVTALVACNQSGNNAPEVKNESSLAKSNQSEKDFLEVKNNPPNEKETEDYYIINRVITVAKLWKNGVAQNLTDGTRSAYAHSVYVSGNDVYVAGYEMNKNYCKAYEEYKEFSIATLWKNGMAQRLTDGTKNSKAYSVYISGKDVYVGGDEDGIAKIWKNGVVQNLAVEIHDDKDVKTDSIFYVVIGYEYSPIAQLWKNGIAQCLTDGTKDSKVRSVYVSGDDVYAVGEQHNGKKLVAKLWKNSVVQDISDGERHARARSVYVSGNNVYVAGYEEKENMNK
jgi:hypothetical protein